MVFASPEVVKVTMQGQETFRVVGDYIERGRTADGEPGAAAAPSIPIEDIELVMGQTGCSEGEARDALEHAKGEPAEAILYLMSKR